MDGSRYDFRTLAVSQTGHVATVTLARPDRMNAVTRRMEHELFDAMRSLDADSSVRIIVLTGEGRAFCAGMDMEELAGLPPEDIDDPAMTRPYRMSTRPDYQSRYGYFPGFDTPIIAAINGAAAGLGLIFALYSDIRIASEHAKFVTAFAGRGLVAEHGISWILPRVVGQAHATEMLFSSRKVSAQEALAMSLVHRVLPSEGFAEAVAEYARGLAEEVSPRSLRVMKRQIWEAPFETLAEATTRANREMVASIRSEDFKEGVAHFLEKRPPAFTGR
ncbi:enoyl-CoA hydratase [Nocardioides marinus]|nr:enoyl-CoA hydratase [Nocardioides marinus]